MFYTAIHQHCWGFYPSVLENFEIDKEHRITFILSDEARVRLVNPPPLTGLVGVEGKWGELKKKLYDLLEEPVRFNVEVISIQGYYWLCVPSQIKGGVNELRGKVFRRNRQIENLRARLQV